MKKIFVNPSLQHLRSGWRMLIFLLIFAAGSGGGVFVLKTTGLLSLKDYADLIAQSSMYLVLLVVTILWVLFYEKRPLGSVGLQLNDRFIIDTFQGLIIGGGMMSGIFIIEWSVGFVHLTFKEFAPGELFHLTSMSFMIFVVGAFGEELMFRGYMFQVLTEGTNKIISITIFALFFALSHLSNPNVTFFSVVNIALAGVWLSVAYFKTRSLWFPIGLHFSWNFMQNHVYSFPVSGIDFTQYQLGVLAQSGPAWITGGAFGPEGGILTTLIVIGSTIVIYYSPWIRQSAQAWKYEEWIENRQRSVMEAQRPIAEIAEITE